MAYVDNNATAWGEIEFKFGAPGAGGAMGTVLKTLGIVNERRTHSESKMYC